MVPKVWVATVSAVACGLKNQIFNKKSPHYCLKPKTEKNHLEKLISKQKAFHFVLRKNALSSLHRHTKENVSPMVRVTNTCRLELLFKVGRIKLILETAGLCE